MSGDTQHLISLLTSPLLSNNLFELRLPRHCSRLITDDLIESILTARVIPGDETTPLKFGKLQHLYLNQSQIGPRTIQLIIQNLPQLTHLDLNGCNQIDDAAVTALIGHEHDDLRYPYPALPNLIHLGLFQSSITDQTFINLSQSQLLDQLEKLNMSSVHLPIPSQQAAEAIFQTPSFSNMKSIYIGFNGFWLRLCVSVGFLDETKHVVYHSRRCNYCNC